MISNLKREKIDQIISFSFPFNFNLEEIFINKKTRENISNLIFKDNINKKESFYFLTLNDEIKNNKNLKKNEVLNLCNPNSFYYYYSILINDFVFFKINNDFKIYKVPLLVCFKTKFPFRSIFFKIFKKIFENIRLDRMTKYNNLLKKKDLINILEIIDTTYIKNYFKKYIENLLYKIYTEIKIELFNENFNIKINKFELKIKVPTKQKSKILELWYSLKELVNIFTFEDFIFLLSCVLREKSILFVSENIINISNSIMTFLKILNPFKWKFTYFYSLCFQYFNFLNNDPPYIIGIKNSMNFVYNNLIKNSKLSSKKGLIIVFIDDNKIISFDNQTNENLNKYPYFLDNNDLYKTYKEINPRSDGTFKIKTKNNKKEFFYLKKKNNNTNKKNFTSVKKEISNNLFNLIFLFKNCIKSFINEFISFQKNYVNENDNDRSIILENIVNQFSFEKNNKEFLNEFFESNMFIEYLEKKGFIDTR